MLPRAVWIMCLHGCDETDKRGSEFFLIKFFFESDGTRTFIYGGYFSKKLGKSGGEREREEAF